MTASPDPALPRVTDILPDGAADDIVTLDYDGRFLRRRRLVSAAGRAFLVDLPRASDLAPGSVLVLSDGARIAVAAEAEALIEVRGDLPRLAWHIGNRHAPCEIGAGALRVRDDHVMADMLARLGADIRRLTAPFRPEGGAYGHGRTHRHAHTHAETDAHTRDEPDAHTHVEPDAHPRMEPAAAPEARGSDRAAGPAPDTAARPVHDSA